MSALFPCLSQCYLWSVLYQEPGCPGTGLTNFIPSFLRPPNPQPTFHNSYCLCFWTRPSHGLPLAGRHYSMTVWIQLSKFNKVPLLKRYLFISSFSLFWVSIHCFPGQRGSAGFLNYSAVRHLQISVWLPSLSINFWPWLCCHQGHKKITEPTSKDKPPHDHLYPKTPWHQVRWEPRLPKTTRLSYCGQWLPLHAVPSCMGSYYHPQATFTPLSFFSDLAVNSSTNPFIMWSEGPKTTHLARALRLFRLYTHRALCPVIAFKEIFEARPPSQELFIRGCIPLLKDAILEVRSALETTGLNPFLYAGHSFRIGAATSATASSIPAHMIQTGNPTHSSFLHKIK